MLRVFGSAQCSVVEALGACFLSFSLFLLMCCVASFWHFSSAYSSPTTAIFCRSFHLEYFADDVKLLNICSLSSLG